MEKQHILIVDDNPEHLLILEYSLENLDLNIVKARSGKEALELLLQYDFGLVILDIMMPDMDSFETAERIRKKEETKDIPIIIITSINKEHKYKFKGYEKGAVDYLIKPIYAGILERKVRVFLKLHMLNKLFEKQTETLHEAERELGIRNRISEIFLTTPDEEIYAEVLNIILEAMESEYGVLGDIDTNGAIVCPSMTGDILNQCQVSEKDTISTGDMSKDILGRALKEKRTFYSNNGPFHIPEGHVPITNTMVAPILHREELIGIIHIANKPTDYNLKDQVLLEIIAVNIAPFLQARIERDRQDKERKRAEENFRIA